jgi:uncharacterized protein YbjT (DUF2867 family)
MEGRTATVIGATGLIGGHIVRLLLDDPHWQTIKVLVRRPVSFTHPKVVMKLVNFTDHESFKLGIEGSDTVFCGIGTTMKKMKGDKVAYRKVDYDIPVHAAQFCLETGCPRFILVSSTGANSSSGNFYLKLKGEVEDAISKFPIKKISFFRPSMLLGNREESRPAEKAGQVIMKALSFAFVGGLKKYTAIEAKVVAAAMVNDAKNETGGIHIYQYEDIKKLAGN